MSKNKKVKIKVDTLPPYKVPKGHSPHKGGAGPHKDKRTKRKRTRSAKNRDAIDGFE